ncbi:MAG: hypothetical protein AAGI06_13920, partial [Pseudomonadota bacterium]
MDINIMVGIAGSLFLLLYIWWVVKMQGDEVPAGPPAPSKRDVAKPLPPDASGTNVHPLRASPAPAGAAPAVRAKTKPAAAPKPQKARRSTAKSKTTTAAKPKRATRTTRSKDELQRINGIGPKIEGQLKAMKITTYAQIAAFKKA